MMKNSTFDKNYWENRYHANEIGWDVGTITTPLKEYIDQIKDKNLKILIPGGGNSYEFEYLIQNNFTNVFVLDIVEAPLLNIKERTSCGNEQLILDDFFNHNQSYDLILEQTFFCALHPDLREKYAAKMHQLLNVNGKLAGLFFDFPLTEDGPPFGGSTDEYTKLFKENFEIKTMQRAHNSIKPRAGRELFVILQKK